MDDLETQLFHHMMNPFPAHEHDDEPLLNNHNVSAPTSSADRSVFRLYSTYPFARLEKFEHLAMKDRALLELSGCLYLPARPQLDDFLVHYFRHVHLYLPVLDEDEFWLMYVDTETGPQRQNPTISLFVLQAMLFAVIGNVDRRTITALGFSRYEDARDTFYQRAKILFDLQAESDSYPIAQGTLLLSFRFALDNPECNVGWLEKAIWHARQCSSDRDDSEDRQTSAASNSRAIAEKTRYRRLWCSCVIRDRILSLGVRTRLLIPPQEFDPEHDLLKEADLISEVSASSVYSTSVRRTLVYLAVKLSRLCGIMTAIVTFAEDIKDMLRGKRELVMADMFDLAANINRASEQLDAWETPSLASLLQERGDPSVMSHAILAYIYYRSSRIRLANAEAMLLEMQDPDMPPERQLTRRHSIKRTLERSVHALVELMKTAVKYDITGHWPISVGAHTFFPAMLLYVDRMLPASPLEMARRVDGYRDAYTLIQRSHIRHGSAERALQHLTATLEEDLETVIFTKHEEAALVTSWSDLIVHFPSLYLKLVLTLENFFECGVVV